MHSATATSTRAADSTEFVQAPQSHSGKKILEKSLDPHQHQNVIVLLLIAHTGGSALQKIHQNSNGQTPKGKHNGDNEDRILK